MVRGQGSIMSHYQAPRGFQRDGYISISESSNSDFKLLEFSDHFHYDTRCRTGKLVQWYEYRNKFQSYWHLSKLTL